VGLIYLDTCIVVYAFETHPAYGERALQAMASVAPERLAISPLVKLECLVGPMRDAHVVRQLHYEQGLARFTTLDLPEPVFLQAAELRARFGLKTPDALHLAAAQFHGCDALWTNDDRLAQAGRGLAVNVVAGR
jgi:predicted nucleic acid-binding protein